MQYTNVIALRRSPRNHRPGVAGRSADHGEGSMTPPGSTSSHTAAAVGPSDPPLPTFDMFEQLALEARALGISAMPQVQQQKKKVEELYGKNWLAGTPDGRARL